MVPPARRRLPSCQATPGHDRDPGSRTGSTEHGRHRLLTLYKAISDGTDAQVEGIRIPARLTTSDSDRHEVRAWLWRVILADGTRTLTTAGRWDDALAHIEQHNGIGQRMLDGRQVAVVAALGHDPADAASLVAQTTPGEPWENAVTSYLAVMCHQLTHHPVGPLLSELVDNYVQRQPDPGTTVFDTRLGLTILDLHDQPNSLAAHHIAEELHGRGTVAADGYAARECLANSRFTQLVPAKETQAARKLVRACAFDSGALPAPHRAQLLRALRLSDEVIRANRTPASPSRANGPRPGHNA
ncbi:cytochrome c551/c552 [Streptomyces rishiriensis]|uniref:Cytochrome c551/c552 n=1 Tax=Streptomyces rishiriensis TaxID=68264 RepID=A0ABU0NGP8_STRRH|nr:cytochrome c551/c552 [Streptomyces rishiriensis]